MELTTQYSAWYLLWCAALAGVYAIALYGRNPQNRDLPFWVVQTLGIIRFSSVFLIALLLLNPFLQNWITEKEPSIIIIAQDNSASIVNSKDSIFYSSEYVNAIQGLRSDISSNYQVEILHFGEAAQSGDLHPDFDDKRTDYSGLFDEIDSRYAGNNIGAVILASDGLYNSGGNPEYYQFKNSYPVYTIGLGDTAIKSDLAIVDIRSNDIVYLGNDFPMEVTVRADLLAGKSAELKIVSKGKVLEKREIQFSNSQTTRVENFVFSASESGTQRFDVILESEIPEWNILNNKRTVLIDVLDNTDKILILAHAPHPDIASIRSVLEEKESYQVEVRLAENFTSDPQNYNLIIAHGFGQDAHGEVWQKIWKSNVPLWCILYARTNPSRINSLNPEFLMDGQSDKENRIVPFLNSEFSAFKLSEETKNYLRKVPPLHSPFSDISGTVTDQILLYQKLGSVETSYPLLYFTPRGNYKSVWLFGEGLWRWKMYDYQENQDISHFSEWVWKTVQYVTVKEDKSRFRLQVNKRFKETESVRFSAEWYDKTYEKSQSAEIGLELTDELGNSFSYAFVLGNIGYSVDLGNLKPGMYSYVATAKESNETLKKSGSFIVEKVDLEWVNTTADFDILRKLASRTNGSFFTVNQLTELATIFDDKTKFPSITYTSEEKKEILHFKWLFALILLLLSGEWMLRKQKGRY